MVIKWRLYPDLTPQELAEILLYLFAIGSFKEVEE